MHGLQRHPRLIKMMSTDDTCLIFTGDVLSAYRYVFIHVVGNGYATFIKSLEPITHKQRTTHTTKQIRPPTIPNNPPLYHDTIINFTTNDHARGEYVVPILPMQYPGNDWVLVLEPLMGPNYIISGFLMLASRRIQWLVDEKRYLSCKTYNIAKLVDNTKSLATHHQRFMNLHTEFSLLYNDLLAVSKKLNINYTHINIPNTSIPLCLIHLFDEVLHKERVQAKSFIISECGDEFWETNCMSIDIGARYICHAQPAGLLYYKNKVDIITIHEIDGLYHIYNNINESLFIYIYVRNNKVCLTAQSSIYERNLELEELTFVQHYLQLYMPRDFWSIAARPIAFPKWMNL